MPRKYSGAAIKFSSTTDCKIYDGGIVNATSENSERVSQLHTNLAVRDERNKHQRRIMPRLKSPIEKKGLVYAAISFSSSRSTMGISDVGEPQRILLDFWACTYRSAWDGVWCDVPNSTPPTLHSPPTSPRSFGEDTQIARRGGGAGGLVLLVRPFKSLFH